MKPQQNVSVNRTQNDTDPMSFVLCVETDTGKEPVADSDVVKMHVAVGSGVTTIVGTAKGDGSGTFLFSPVDIMSYSGVLRYELEVTRSTDGVIYTVCTGCIITTLEIG